MINASRFHYGFLIASNGLSGSIFEAASKLGTDNSLHQRVFHSSALQHSNRHQQFLMLDYRMDSTSAISDTKVADSLLQQFGWWLGPAVVGVQESQGDVMINQHANLAFQKKYYP